MVISVHLALGSAKYGDIVDAAKKANVTRLPVYFQLDTRYLYKKPTNPMTDADCVSQCQASGGGNGKLKGKGPRCIPSPEGDSDIGDYEIHQCMFTRAQSCLTALYTAWANCVFTWPGLELYQGGNIASILCDNCMNTKLGAGGSDIFVSINTYVPVNCITNCEMGNKTDDGYDGCAAKAQAGLEPCNNDCHSEYLTCLDATQNVDTDCREPCQEQYTTCIDTADANFNTCLDAAADEHGTCVFNCGTDSGCIDACNATFDAAITACQDLKNTEINDCQSENATCIHDCDNLQNNNSTGCAQSLNDCNERCSTGLNNALRDCSALVQTCVDRCNGVVSDAATAQKQYRDAPPGARMKQASSGGRLTKERLKQALDVGIAALMGVPVKEREIK